MKGERINKLDLFSQIVLDAIDSELVVCVFSLQSPTAHYSLSLSPGSCVTVALSLESTLEQDTLIDTDRTIFHQLNQLAALVKAGLFACPYPHRRPNFRKPEAN